MLNRSIRVLAILSATVLLQSCYTNSESSDDNSNLPGEVVKGSYIYGNEVSSFQPCGLTAEFWVIGEQKLMNQLQNNYMELASKPYQQVFVSFRGSRQPKAEDGFAADYSGQFKVTEVIKLQEENICP